MDWLVLAEAIASQIDQEEREELTAEASDLADAERATLTFEDRLRGAIGSPIGVQLRGMSGWLEGRVEAVGQGWFLVSDSRREWIAFTRAVVGLRGPALARAAEMGLPVTITAFLRRLQGTFVQVTGDAGEVDGTIVGVGRDHLLIEGEIEARYGSYAPQWQAHYSFGESERLSQIVIPITAIAVVSQALVNRV